ncbi:hypothetical protein [Paucibacter sp. DJ2R-2]|uniref:hypothetical protein n=1 Tax=Paucibacter sp. DJ2R-2 TaxID=2893558 RepID=UPI00398D105E
MARVVQVFGSAKPHHADLYANRRATLMKVLAHDGIGAWLSTQARRPKGRNSQSTSARCQAANSGESST